MSLHFPLFHSHIDLAHQYWEKLLQPGDWAIDATCGNGYDTLQLAKILLDRGSCKTPRPRKIDDFGVHCQSQLAGSCPSDETILERVGKEEGWQRMPKGRLCGGGEFCNCLDRKGGIIGMDIQPEALAKTKELLESHGKDLNQIHLYCQSHETFPVFIEEKPIRLIVYNLGYLPGGNKNRTTMTESTLASVRKASQIVLPGGALSITCYPGHAEGAREEEVLLQELSQWPSANWNICYHTFPLHRLAPSLLIIQKNSASRLS